MKLQIYKYIAVIGSGCIISLSSIGFAQVAHAADQSEVIFAIRAYTKDKITEGYIAVGQGSATAINDKQLITNAHVVLDENQEPYKYYEICSSSTSYSKDFICFGVGELIAYDKELDIAMIESIKTLPTSGTIFADSDPTMGDDVTVYGYPRNGGSSLTITKGIISGQEKGKLKIDANLDSGNSGGGAFDNDGNYVGMPTSATLGITALGYIVPVSKIKTFVLDEPKRTIDTEAAFIAHNAKTFKALQEQTLETSLYRLNDTNLGSVRLTGIAVDSNTNLQYASFSDESGLMEISISTHHGYGFDNPINVIKNGIDGIYEEVYTKIKQGSINKPTLKAEYTIGYDSSYDNDSLTMIIYINVNGSVIRVEGNGTGNKKNELIQAISTILSNINIQDATTHGSTISKGKVTFTSSRGVAFIESIDGSGELTLHGGYSNDEKSRFIIFIESIEPTEFNNEVTSINDLKESTDKTLSLFGIENVSQVKKNSKGNSYIERTIEDDDGNKVWTYDFLIRDGDLANIYTMQFNNTDNIQPTASHVNFFVEKDFGNDRF